MKTFLAIIGLVIIVGIAIVLSMGAVTFTAPKGNTGARTENGLREVTVSVGQSKEVQGVTITLNSVVQDNRCPVNVQCIEGGAISTNVTFLMNSKKEDRFMPSDEVPQEFEGKKISIVAINPPRTTTEDPKQETYKITFRVE